MLLAAGQPVFAEDTWWHLGMGRAYAEAGPRLAADPFLLDALGPPAPAAWLADRGLWWVLEASGFTGLRVLHAACVLAIFALVWTALRRASASPLYASLGTAVFAALAAYRLFQLRPHLATIAAGIAVVCLLLAQGRRAGWGRVALASAVFALWANLHGAVLVGLVLLAAALAGCVASLVLDPASRDRQRERVPMLAAALGLGLLATFANPRGAGLHALYFSAGAESPDLARVSDEWASARLLAWPTPGVMPDPLDWALLWALAAGAAWGAWVWLRGARHGRPERPLPDPALVGVALASVVGMALALRLSWLAFFPLLLLGQLVRGLDGRAVRRLAVAGLAVGLLFAFLGAGSWHRISRGVRPETWDRPYPATKHYAHAVWFLRDTGLEGRLFNDYASGNFLGYWLAPGLRVFVNGSLNVPKERLADHAAVLRASGRLDGETLEQLLDRYEIDVFFGTGLPLFSEGRPESPTTAHLERAADWVPVFRNLRSAVYLRRGPAGAANLGRVARYYEREGVPFDPERGFEVARVVREAPAWAFANGVVPHDWARLLGARASLDPGARAAAARLGRLQAALGLYDASLATDARLLRSAEAPVPAARRRVWSLARTGRFEEAREAAGALERLAPGTDGASGFLVSSARRIADLAAAGREPEAASLAASLPVFERHEAPGILAGYREPDPRTR